MHRQPKLQPATCLYYPTEWGAVLLEDYQFDTTNGGSFVIPKGFWYNGASIPEAFWQLTFAPSDFRILAGALVHDWLYSVKIVPREVADATLAKYLLEFSDSPIKTKMVKLAVNWFGGMSWKDSPNDIRYLNYLRSQIRLDGRDTAIYGL